MHTNYFEVEANSNYELGEKLGMIFKDKLHKDIATAQASSYWERRSLEALKYLQPTQNTFPHYIEELQGYAKAAEIPFNDLWTLSLEDEVYFEDKCTTFITNKGLLIGHNEDQGGATESVCVLKKTIKETTILELYYLHTLGGNAISINSNGYIQAINSLSQTDKRLGVPRNVIARWVSETSSVENDLETLKGIERSSGFGHNVVDRNGNAYNIESSATELDMQQVDSPYVHANHYLRSLKKYEANHGSTYTFNRYECGINLIKDNMTTLQMQDLLKNRDTGEASSIFNSRTVGSMIVDLGKKVAYIWLARENEKGWIEYNIDFIK
ncbi:MAG TPA: C45 family autoproteolytic acyltransferase/hydrolase [Candidatus Dojkabacteria bacterium]|nr:C45 family autoproteolytic acyltransferase/hydrolase [Candidatus Dojkabacteria bacterium]